MTILGKDVLRKPIRFIKRLFKKKNKKRRSVTLKRLAISPEIKISLVLIIAFLLLIPKINQPFWGHHEWNGVFYSNIARNYLRYGFLTTKLGEVSNYGMVRPADFRFHTQHPVLFPIFLAVFFKLFGVSEISARLFAIFFSLTSLVVLNLILKKIFRLRYSCFYLLLAILTPLFLYYARMPVYEPIISLFILLAIYFYFSWRKEEDKKYFILTTLSLFICQMIEWPGFYLAAILFSHHLLFPVRKEKRFVGLWWLVLSLASFLVIVFHQFILTGQIGGSLARIFLVRLTGGNGHPFTFWQFFRIELARMRSFFTSAPLVLAFFWLIVYWKKVFQKKKILACEHFVIFYLFFGLMHIVIFPNVAWYHDYMLYYFFWPLLLAASLGLRNILSFIKSRQLLVFCIILSLVFLEKRQFLLDLKNLNPHVNCVKWGREIKEGKRKPVIETEDREVAKICPPFTSYYADQAVEFKLIKNE